MSLNRVVLVGRLTRDPELKYTGTGIAVCSFTLAINRPFKNAEGNNEADFINIVVWRKPAENTAQYTKKGSLVGVDGRLQSRSYDDKDGKKVYVTEVVADSVQFLEPKSGNQSGNNSQAPPQNQQPQGQQSDNDPFQGNGEPIDIQDDDLPF